MYKKLSLFSVLLVLGVLLLSAYMRASDAGLGCPEWPGCYGSSISDSLPAAHGLESSAAAEEHARWKSVALRSLAAALGVSVSLLVLASAWARRRSEALVLSLIALLLVGLQFSLGFWAARWLSAPLVLSLHGLLGLLALSVLYGLHSLQRPATLESGPTRVSALHWLARAGLLALLVEIALGGWMSIRHAGLACPDFPTCMGSYTPPLDFAAAFSLPDPGAQGGVLPQVARAAIHWAHRIGAVLVFVLLSLLALAISSNQAVGRLSKAGVLLNFLLLLQVCLGIAGVVLRLPVAIVVAHSAVALLLWLNVLHIVFYLRLRAPEAVIPQPALPEEITPIPAPVTGDNLFARLRGGLGKTRNGLSGFLGALGQKKIDRDLLDDIEAQLLMSDMGVTVTNEVVAELTQSLERSQLGDAEALATRLREQLYRMLSPCSIPLEIAKTGKPFVILVVGVNGVGKTTTIGKLANHLKTRGLQVMLAAGDTFRAAAVEQLQSWGERNQIPVISQGSGADSASVIFDGVQAAQARGADVLIADTAGRLHTKSNLMEELSKIKRIMARLDPEAPHEVLLVLDAGTGQNAISQARLFNEAVGLTGLVITKLDGTAKGGVVFALARQFGIPIRFIGVGEGIEDLQDFDARSFIDALFDRQAACSA
ncbi:signal recognition particle-docking protein FtsY [Candidatus Methylospira mobilis]|uniref:Signal recognition particle receptor FtsY n=1 Tax=Candidatus Methylospira mobilis TaxID=1808979 RepID=A0A5Q0BJL4_9GAMM|nr:signal recognition particle-docking protein FtsY [Candidatus Methylospira mobilis]QFY44065.1 signal recognition particle-docking protein FtsY [Candidatus Methylospira mobilis]WNV05070.1 signal recognition particle-docking protein FtsY [Candidatus Methylospira mobilis]